MTDHAFPEVTIRGDRIRLRPLTAADVAPVVEASSDEVTQTWLPLPRPYVEADGRRFCLEFAPRSRETGQGIVFGIELEGRLAGAIDLKRTDWRARSTEIGYWAAPWARGRGLMREAVRLLTRWVIEEQGFARVEIRVATGNVASQRVAEGAGYTREGILRSAGFVHDGRVDLIVYSFIEGDRGYDPLDAAHRHPDAITRLPPATDREESAQPQCCQASGAIRSRRGK